MVIIGTATLTNVTVSRNETGKVGDIFNDGTLTLTNGTTIRLAKVVLA